MSLSYVFAHLFLTQNKQDRQTQVLALPARAEGSDRETEGILY